MKYIVIQGRAPQDGSEARKALFVCPSWLSSTLVCAGIVGRVIELTDGNILEEGELPECATEENFLEIMEEMRDADQAPSRPHPGGAIFTSTTQGSLAVGGSGGAGGANGVGGSAVESHVRASIDPDDAYREGNQAMRLSIHKVMVELGMPEDAKPGQWMKEQLGALVEAQAQLKQFEGGATRQRFDETLAELQTEQANLDAWRTAAGAAELCIEHDANGRVLKIFTAEQSGGPSHPELLDSYQSLQEDYNELQRDYEFAKALNARLEKELDGQSTIINCTGPVTVNNAKGRLVVNADNVTVNTIGAGGAGGGSLLALQAKGKTEE